MSDATEIYICKPGQAIKEGRMEFSSAITTAGQAEADALQKCAGDPSVGKVVYYAVSEDGSFKTLFSYDNPQAGKPKRRPATANSRDPYTSGKGTKRRQKQSLMDRLRTVFE
jgi:hypothetical protein